MSRPERALSGFLVRLRECVCEELKETLAGPVCRCSLVHSEVEILDGCNCACPDGATGRAMLRVVTIDAVSAQSGVFVPCPSAWQATIEIDVTRCVLDCKAEIPDDAVLETEALHALSDYAALKRAIICCAKQGKYKPEAINWRPLGPDGCCYGGAMTLQVRIE